ncbi:RodZ domain-containing protein [Nitrococcus mobilis]|uniref:Cytoskeleton protein RodZ-like C-terminal domain-containing protein n=1 Tax=Nitrococcus mobilis Nb-231 TaxID=314278 RepID=A4BSV3_9GAMM|nr:RodZ domain-containing protein [Nitrococcus mobilis]EAR21197.1 hypothetical protein NB231_00710 [Nitrococcus mobilis Nb-231]
MEGSERLHTAVEIESLSKERHGPGLSLRQARERCRLSVASIADTLHLEPRVIEALEADDYSQLPPVTYVRGYLSAYARLVNLPVANVLQAFERVGGEERSQPLTLHAGRAGNRRMARFSIGSSWLLTLAFIAVLISGWMFWTQGQSTSEVASPDENNAVDAGPDTMLDPKSEPDAAAAGSEILAAPTGADTALPAHRAETASLTTQPAAPPGERLSRDPHMSGAETAGETSAVSPTPQREAPLIPSAKIGTASIADHKPAALAATTVGVAPESIAAQRAGALETLKFDASGKSWVTVEAAGGQRLVYGLLERGESRRVTGRPPFRITIGDATQVMLRHNGTRVDLGPYTHANVARFTLSATHD